MIQTITEQIEKFKTGDFSGYESFYNETVQTVYTMLQTIVGEEPATSLIPQVYDKIYQNVTSLEQTEGFYQWTAQWVNEEALEFLKKQFPMNSNPSGGEEATEQFYDYAMEDEALTIKANAVENVEFVMKLQEIVNSLSPIEKIIFQDYYYFGRGISDITTETGCSYADIRQMLGKTRTSILQAVECEKKAEESADTREYRLADAPWLWIAYQNFLGYMLGFDTVSISGFPLGILGQASGGMAAGSAGGGVCAATAGASGSAAAVSAGASGTAAGIFGTIGGKIAIGVVATAIATTIGVGVHHVVASQNGDTQTTVATTEQAQAEMTTQKETTEVSIETTEKTTEGTTAEQPTTEADNSMTAGMINGKVDTEYSDVFEAEKQADPRNGVYICQDVDGDGVNELVVGSFVIYQATPLYFCTDVKSVYKITDGEARQIYQKPVDTISEVWRGDPFFITKCTENGIMEHRSTGKYSESNAAIGSTALYVYEGDGLRFDRATIKVWRSSDDYKVYEVTDQAAYDALHMATESSDDTIASQVEANPDAFRLLSAENPDPMDEDDPYNLPYVRYQTQAWKPLDEQQCVLTNEEEFQEWMNNGMIADEDGKF